MVSDGILQLPSLEQHNIQQNDIETMLEVLPDYGMVKNKGQLEEQRNYSLGNEGFLEEDEKPKPVGRTGESSLKIAYDDFQYHFAGMTGQGEFNVPDHEKLNIPEENTDQALGALFGASYALFRDEVITNGHPADHSEFKQDIETQEERDAFFDEGAYELQGEVMGQWGYDHKTMNEIMDAEEALNVYREVTDQIV